LLGLLYWHGYSPGGDMEANMEKEGVVESSSKPSKI